MSTGAFLSASKYTQVLKYPQSHFFFQIVLLAFPLKANTFLCWLLGKNELPRSSFRSGTSCSVTFDNSSSSILLLSVWSPSGLSPRTSCLILSLMNWFTHFHVSKSPSVFTSLLYFTLYSHIIFFPSLSCHYKYLDENNCRKFEMLHLSSLWLYEPGHSIRQGKWIRAKVLPIMFHPGMCGKGGHRWFIERTEAAASANWLCKRIKTVYSEDLYFPSRNG